ncbi:MAG: hypothetical protein IJZ56_06825, partial [Oscillospiraceae bacterium]|nr:hypothetical protein [Oscillospiraceae bacterium]
MKRIMPIILMLILLCGCAKETGPAPTGESTTVPTGPVAVDTYVSNSSIEQTTNGAVRQYALPESTVTWIAPIYGGVLVAEAGEQSVLTILSGEDGTVTATADIPAKLDNSSVWQVTPTGFVYYEGASREVVFLDLQLAECSRLQLPEDITGDPAISPNGSQVYYCQGQTVYSMEVERKISRPVRTNTCQDQTLLGCYLDGTVVACSIQDVLEDWSTIYISGENGELLHKDNGIKRVYSYGDDYFALRADGIVSQYIYGSTDSAPTQMNISDAAAYGALELGGIIGQTEAADGVRLSFYNMKKTAAVTLPQEMKLAQVAADSTTGGVWLLTEGGELLHWSLQASAVTEDTDYTGTIYTAQAPDTDGLEVCADRADAMGKKHGVVIRVWERALVSNDNFDIEVEYQPEAINKTLDALETEL